jgi:hypothetical protein
LATPASPFEAPPPVRRYPAPEELPRSPSGGRLRSGVVLIVASLFVLGAAFTPWWFMTVNAGGDIVTIDFYPGNTASGSLTSGPGNSSSSTVSYQSAGFGAFAALYEAIFVVALVAFALAFAGGLIGVLVEYGRLREPWRGRKVLGFATLAFLVLLALVVVAAAQQPAQFHAANPAGICTDSQGTTTPCNAFSGSLSSSTGSLDWGGGAGWFLAIFGCVFSFLGAIQWWRSAEDPYELEPVPPPRAFAPPLAWQPAPPFGVAGPARLPPPSATPVPSVAPAVGARPSAAPPPSASARTLSAYAGSPAGISAARGPVPAAARPWGSPSPAPAAPSPVTTPAPEPGGLTEVQQLVRLKLRLDAGGIAPQEFLRAKASLLAASAASPAAPVPGASTPADLHALEQLRDAGALSGPEYLQLRRTIILRG